jgi:multidrug resistance efflux pump
MKRLKNRPRLDALVTQQRTGGAPWGRRIYLALLTLLGLSIADYFVGDALWLDADGVLLADRHAVDAVFPARIAEVLVRPGDKVARGQLLMKLESLDIQREIADLSARDAELGVREAQLRVDQSRVAALLPVAERWSKQARTSLAKFDSVSAKGLITTQSQNQAMSALYDSAAKNAELEGQSQVLTTELPRIAEMQRRAHDALEQLRASYDDGAVRAPADGVVGPHVADVGRVARAGEELTLVYGRDSYVLAYLPNLYLFAIAKGDRVLVNGGPGAPSVVGTVADVLDVAESPPQELQSKFRPTDRNRLIRISIPKDSGLALAQTVRVSGCALGWCWRGRQAPGPG